MKRSSGRQSTSRCLAAKSGLFLKSEMVEETGDVMWGEMTKPNFYTLFSPLGQQDTQLCREMKLARDDFDRGAIWIINQLNRANLSEALVHFEQERQKFT